MGNNTVIKNSQNIFIEQLKIDSRSEYKILGIYMNPHEFPQSGLIIISNKSKIQINLKKSNIKLLPCKRRNFIFLLTGVKYSLLRL